jgi:hypothetical protein
VTDLVVTTCNRLELLKRTLTYIWERTTSPYRLHLLDDASGAPTVEYLRMLYREEKIDSVYFGKRPVGIPGQLRRILRVTESDPVVFTDDDVLCPSLEPDWLARGLAAMRRYSHVGLLSLNGPQCNIDGKRGETEPHGEVTFCRNVPGWFAFARREVLATCQPEDDAYSPVKQMCKRATDQGWQIAYLTDVYCQHIGAVSVRNNKDLSGELALVEPIDAETLLPPERYRG